MTRRSAPDLAANLSPLRRSRRLVRSRRNRGRVDLRRTVRTRLSAIPNISDLVRELVIGHTKPGLHKVYDQYAYLDEKRFALDAWAARLRSIVEPPPANVVELRAAP